MCKENNWANVQWDGGMSQMYRIGANGHFDLLTLGMYLKLYVMSIYKYILNSITHILGNYYVAIFYAGYTEEEIRSDPLPTFSEIELENHTVRVGNHVRFACPVKNLGNYKVI